MPGFFLMLKSFRKKLADRIGSYTTSGPSRQNMRTGGGGSGDKGFGTQFIDRLITRKTAETVFRMSWVARKIIEIPIDDMFVRGRNFEGEESQVEAFEEKMKELKCQDRLASAMKAGRLFGTAFLVIVPTGNIAQMEMPFDPERVARDGIANLWVVDRWAAYVHNWQSELTMPGFGEPYQYRITRRGLTGPNPTGQEPKADDAQVIVHNSWLLRFDGHPPLLTEGWTSGVWEREWGISVLAPILQDIAQDSDQADAVSHLIQELSIFVRKVDGLKEALAGREDPAEASVEELAEATNSLKSIYRTMFIDQSDEVDRVTVTLTGLADVLDRHARRIAAMSDIPETRFWGRSPAGMNATGESDANNYSVKVDEMREKMLTEPLRKLDMAIAKAAGLSEPPDYEWLPLLDLSKEQRAIVEKTSVEAIVGAYGSGLVDEDEARERLQQIEGWGELGPWTPSQSSEIELEQQVELEKQRQNARTQNGPGNPPAS